MEWAAESWQAGGGSEDAKGAPESRKSFSSWRFVDVNGKQVHRIGPWRT